jgi:creatinine amidohydrolase
MAGNEELRSMEAKKRARCAGRWPLIVLLATVLLPQAALPSTGQARVAAFAPARASVYIADMTWPEIQRQIQAGKTTVIIPSGGSEQNGLHMVVGKHNRIVHYTAGQIARRLGNALVAPVIPYVPEGGIQPPTGHMRFTGTVSLPEPVYEAVLENVARSMKVHGFRLICLIGDHGGSQEGQRQVADRLDREWQGSGVRVLDVDDYYAHNGQQQWLEKQGETPQSIGTHAGIRDTSELLAIDPGGVRQALLGHPSPSSNGRPDRASARRGRVLLQLKINAAVRQIQRMASAGRATAAVPALGRPRVGR